MYRDSVAAAGRVAFRVQAHRQSLAVANSFEERDDQAFIDAISDLTKSRS
ncbi:MAG TPA: antitoxin MazE-like protein [Methyloceanibacter sp.]|nr:antitoxin MazE-like protein [Methyloceanibacter sp.]